MAPPAPSWQQGGHAAAVLSSAPLLILVVVAALAVAPPSATAIGVNYGTKGDNLPPPATVAAFLANRTRIDRVKLFDTNPDMVRAFAGTGIAVTVTAGNGDIPALATKDGAAAAWVSANVAPYYPATAISLVAVGNEIMDTGDPALISNLVPAMRAVRAALAAAGFRRIRVSTPHSLGILAGASEPPSASRFRDGWDRAVFAPMLAFHRQSRSPFMVNPYPYFGYNGDTLPYALARPPAAASGNAGVTDPGTGIRYTSMFEAQLDSVYSAMKRLGFGDVEIAVGETGWPTKAMDGQIGVSVAEAAEYNRYLIGEVSGGGGGGGRGTPLMPNRTFETYIFALFNENLKPGPVAERNFGLFYANLTPVYDVGLMKDGAGGGGGAKAAPATPAPAPAAATKGDVEEAAAAPEETAASASAPAPSSSASVDDEAVSSEDTGGPSPSEAPSQSDSDSAHGEKTPEEEGGDDAPPPASAAADGSSETAAKDGDAAEGGKTPAPAGAKSKGGNLRVPVSSVLTIVLSLALIIGV